MPFDPERFQTASHDELSAYVTKVAEQLKGMTERSHQTEWRYSLQSDAAKEVPDRNDWHDWPEATVNDRGHIAWERGKQSIWLCQQFTIPETLDGFPVYGMIVRLGLTWWAEAVEVYVDGQLVQEGDLFDYFSRIKLSDRAVPGDTFTVAIHMLSPGHDDGALVRSDLIYESGTDAPEPGFVADELTILRTYAETLAPENLRRIAEAIASLDWSVVSQQEHFQTELAALRERLYPLSEWVKQRQITCVGHAHLDLAWLWPVEDTWRAAERTFTSVLSLQETFPELTYTHSSPALFNWLETHRPVLFRRVVEAVKAGTWAIDAGLWVEPELNVIGGESIARQILYGQRYSRSRFGSVSAIAWLPDSFGFSWQLPQLLALGGVKYFATQKLRWNESTLFPYDVFEWEGLDGTTILSLTLPPIGSDVNPTQMASHSAHWEDKTGLTEILWLPGMGDHGGGPTRDMLEKARRWANSPFFPQLKFASVVEHLDRLAVSIEDTPTPASPEDTSPATLPDTPTSPLSYSASGWPVWKNELYLELHRGCYTVHADQKWYSRRCEDTLREAELFAAIAHMQGQLAYPQATLETAWKQVLFNQFHDILPGTAIPEVFETANPEWQAAYDSAKMIRAKALEAIACSLALPSPPSADAIPLVVFNSLNWERTDLVEVALANLPEGQDWKVVDPQTGQPIQTQLSHYSDWSERPPCAPEPDTHEPARLLFLATVPSVGYRVFWLVAGTAAGTIQNSKFKIQNSSPEWSLENEQVRAVIDSASGNLAELWEKQTGTNVVRSPANQLQAFQDSGQYWDAWDIAPNYESHPLASPQLQSIEWLERGPLRQRVRVVQTFGRSTFQQDYVLDCHLPYLKVETVADWHETQVVLKAAFPLAFASDHATYEIPFGAIARPTNSTDPHEQAKWEVPALRWASMSDGSVGLSILTDYKHGFDAKPDQLRLTLLTAPLWPDPNADRGRHRFTYALYPHSGNWQAGKVPNQAIAFNNPLRPVIGTADEYTDMAGVDREESVVSPYQQSFLDLGTDGVHLAALKLSEDNAERYVLRCWELYGQSATLEMGGLAFQRTNLLEENLAIAQSEILTPWQIATLSLPKFIDESSALGIAPPVLD